MSEVVDLLFIILIGFGLGTMFFYGLWKTICKITTAKAPILWLLVSMILRISITVIGFYLVALFQSNGQLKRLLLCLFGFLLARFVITKIVKTKNTGGTYAP